MGDKLIIEIDKCLSNRKIKINDIGLKKTLKNETKLI